ncbi:hypothetical protein IAT38_003846 [Cryptococcus sp. DSM 104549]
MSSPPTSASSPASFALPKEDEENLAISDRKDTSSVWAVKIPKFLLERWEKVQEGGIELGRLVVDNSTTPPKITLRLTDPEDGNDEQKAAAKRARYDTQGLPDEYSVHVPEERSKNTFVFSETKRTYVQGQGSGGQGVPRDAWGKRKREKANPKLIAQVNHECYVQPINNDKYRKVLDQRRLESEQSKRPVMRMEDTGLSQAEQNQLASGFRAATSTFGSNMILSGKQNTGERFARLERHELTDRIFQCFREKPYWGVPALKATLKQPDGWLREVLRDVAEQIKEGQYMNMWQLKDNWKEDGGSGKSGVKSEVKGEVKGEPMNDVDEKPVIDDDDEDMDDFEEVV